MLLLSANRRCSQKINAPKKFLSETDTLSPVITETDRIIHYYPDQLIVDGFNYFQLMYGISTDYQKHIQYNNR